MRSKIFIFVLAIGISIFTSLSSSYAQSGATSARLTGTVTDGQGAVIGGAIITVKDISTNVTREALTNEAGNYSVIDLLPGSYEVIINAEGFKKVSTRADLELGTTTRVNVLLETGVSTEIVEVIASPVVDPNKTQSSTNIDTIRIDNLPINRRNFLDFSLTAARVTIDRLPNNGTTATSGLSVNGQSARFNNITIDGFNNNSTATGGVRTTFSQDAVQEFQIVSDNYSAEFGRAIGGIINIVTKGGGNIFHGDLFGFVRNDETSARDAFVPFEPDFKQYQAGATLSGPIKQDKAFFFTSFERLSVKQNTIVTISDMLVASARRLGYDVNNGARPFAVGTSTVLARIEAQLNPSNRLALRYNGGFTYDGAFETFGDFNGGLVSETTGGILRLQDNAFAVSNIYVNTALKLVNETRFIYSRRQQSAGPTSNLPLIAVTAPEGRVSFGRNQVLPQLAFDRDYQIVNNVSISRDRQQIKFGVDFNYLNFKGTRLDFTKGGLGFFVPLDFAQLSGIPGLPAFTGPEAFDPALRSEAQRNFLRLFSGILPSMVPGFPAGLPLADLPISAFYLQAFGDGGAGDNSNTKFFSLFVQDDIRLRENLLVKLGLRYDLNRLRFMPKNDGNISPRIALSYTPGRLPNFNVRASYGIFFGVPPTALDIFFRNYQQGFTTVEFPFPFSILPFTQPGFKFPESNQVSPGTMPQLTEIFQYAPKVRNSYAQQANLGFAYFLDNNTEVSVSYNYVRGIKLPAPRNINPVIRPVPNNPLLSALFGRSDPTRGTIFQFQTAADSYYHAVTFQINRRLSNRFGLLAHYTLSKSIDNAVDAIRSDLERPQDPLRPDLERSLSLQDVRHRFVASGIWELSYTKNPVLRDFQVSSIMTIESGRPYNLITGVDLDGNGDAPPGDRPLRIGRNAGQTPGFATVDLRVTRAVPINERVRVQGFFEVFNLFNRVNISNIVDTFPPDVQGRFNLPPQKDGRFIVPKENFRKSFASRQCQIGLRVTF
ncbi:MAG: TonB-dependent receptor [Acidobacteriota bacterium]